VKVREMVTDLEMVKIVARPFDFERRRRRGVIGNIAAAIETNIPYLSTEPLSYLN
jgi:hypothetical protein